MPVKVLLDQIGMAFTTQSGTFRAVAPLDLSIAIAESRRNGASLPVTALVDQFYSEVEKIGGKRWDTSSLLARLEHADKK